jgi:hypothetical protein
MQEAYLYSPSLVKVLEQLSQLRSVDCDDIGREGRVDGDDVLGHGALGDLLPGAHVF